MFTSKLLTKLEGTENFNWRDVEDDGLDNGLFAEAQFLRDIESGQIDAVLRSKQQLLLTYPDNSSILLLYRPTEDDVMVYPGNDTSYEAKKEVCRCLTALVSNGEVVALLPERIMKSFMRA